jgi:N-acetylglucosamine kinase-like BadF-type ATPase
VSTPNASPPLSGAELVIGIDGGGTKTVAWLANLAADGDVVPVGRGEAGPGNPRAAGFVTAQGSIRAAIDAAFASAGWPRQTAAAACFGLSGAGRVEEQERIRSWALQAGIASQVRVTHDAETILAAASPDTAGIALIAGTGSLAWGRNHEGHSDRTGGWGYLLGDEGAGYWVALAGLRAAVRAADGRGQPTHLLPRFLAALHLQQPTEIIGRVYGTDLSRDELAQLSRVVFDAAMEDGVAAEIVTHAAEELARMTATLASKLQFAAGDYTLALTGSVLIHQPRLRELLMELLRDAGAEPDHVQVVTDPVAGAIVLARQLVASSPPS